jgi:hypothetical protein
MDSFRAFVGVQLAVDVLGVVIQCMRGNDQLGGNLLWGEIRSQQLYDLYFAAGQGLGQRHRWRLNSARRRLGTFGLVGIIGKSG